MISTGSNKISKYLSVSILYVFSALVALATAILFISFPAGAYFVFNTGAGNDVTLEDYFYFYYIVLPFPNPFVVYAPLGVVFSILWTFYVIVFAIGFSGPGKNLFRSINDIIKNRETSFWRISDNRILISITWLGVFLVATRIVDIIQSLFGISIGRIEFDNYLVQFIEMTAAPLREELGFRVLLIGLPLILVLGNISSIKNFFLFLWHPARERHTTDRKVIFLIVISALIFGLSHITFSSGWEYGKITQATMGGVILGWIYYRHGFPAAILLHWASNFGIFAFGFLGYALYGYQWYSTTQNSLLATLEIVLTLIGIIAIGLFLHSLYRKHSRTVAY